MADIRKRVGTKGVTWQVRFNDPNTGKSRYKTFPLRKHADAFLTDLNHSTYIHDNDTISLSDAVERWLDVCENTGRKGREPVEKATLRKYKEHAEIIRNMIGNVKLNGLTSVFCNNFRDDLLRLYSRKYAKKILTSFKSILSQARIDGRLRHDPAEGTAIIISQRSEKKEEMDIPSLLEVKALLDKANKLEGSKNQKIQKAWRRYCPFFMVLAYSGMRPGEALGLPWKNVDFENSTITVSQDATEDREIGMPKSSSAYRTIHMPDIVMKKLRKWNAWCPVSDEDLVFPNWKGGIESLSNITNRGWYVLQKECGLLNEKRKPKYPLKSLRHVRASLEIHNGATAKEIQILMGHSTVKITFDVYGHLFKDHTDKRAERANSIAEQLAKTG